MTNNRGWMAISMQCDICDTIWAAIAPVGAIEAECPKCGHFCSIPGCWEAIEAAEQAAKGGDASCPSR